MPLGTAYGIIGDEKVWNLSETCFMMKGASDAGGHGCLLKYCLRTNAWTKFKSYSMESIEYDFATESLFELSNVNIEGELKLSIWDVHTGSLLHEQSIIGGKYVDWENDNLMKRVA